MNPIPGLDVRKKALSLSADPVTCAANHFTETAIPTGLSPAGGIGFRLLAVLVGQSSVATGPFDVGAFVSQGYVYGQVTARSHAGALAASDPDVLGSFSVAFAEIMLTSGTVGFTYATPINMGPFSEEIIVGPNLYVGILTAPHVTASLSFRVYYEPVKLSEVEILRIING